MSCADFEYLIILINLVGHRISKKDTNYRNAIPVKELLAITLRFIATVNGGSYHSLMNVFKSKYFIKLRTYFSNV